MLRALLGKLKGSPDLTADWPQASGPTPAIDCARESIGGLRFGDDLELARKFGRPDRFRWTQPDYCELLYAPAGFQIDFEARRLAYAAFFVGPDEHVPSVPAMSFSSLQVDSTLVSRETSSKQIEAAFGRPSSQDVDAEESVLFYPRGKLTLEFEFSAAGMLKRVN